MIVGHIGVAAALQRARPRAAPWWLLVAAVAPDLVDVGYALAGVCNPFGLFSHTLPAAALIAACLGGAALLTGRRETAAVVVLLVLLHLPPDFITGRKLYWPGGELHGLQLYHRPLADFLLESLVLGAGWLLVHPVAAVPRWMRSAWTLGALLLVQGTVDRFSERLMKPTACAAPAVSALR